jgi:hypothetical protein
LLQAVCELLSQRWSPQQVSRHLRHKYPCAGSAALDTPRALAKFAGFGQGRRLPRVRDYPALGWAMSVAGGGLIGGTLFHWE